MPNIPTGMTISVKLPSSSITVKVILFPSFTKEIVLPSKTILPPVPPDSELNKDSAISLES